MDVEGDIAYGQPGPGLARFSRELDLLVVGSRRLARWIACWRAAPPIT